MAKIEDVRMELSERQLKSAIRKQKLMILRAGFDPTWELFSKTLGWFQIQKKYPGIAKVYKECWEKVRP